MNESSERGLPAQSSPMRRRDRVLEAPRRLRDLLRAKVGFANISGHYVRLDLLDGKSPVVVDAGANRGGFLTQLPLPATAKALAIEPNPELAEALQRFPGFRTLQCGLGAKRGLQRFFVSENSEASSMLESYASKSGITGEVQVVIMDLDQVFEELGANRIDLLKMDIEGEEVPILLEVREETLARIEQITVEFHVFLGGAQELERVRRVVSRLRRLRFTTFNAPRHGTDFSNVLFLNRDLVRLSRLSRFYLTVLDPVLSEVCSILERLRWNLHRIRTRASRAGER